QPISTDTGYFAAWAEIWALGVDYASIAHATTSGLNPGVSIGYDKYGLIRVGTRASYALTPDFTVRAAANANWTAEAVDTQTSTIVVSSGITPCSAPGFAAAGQDACKPTGNASYLGSEINLGF